MKTKKMTEGNPFQTIFVFAMPMILSNLFQQFYNVIDTLIVGNRLGKDALAAVGSASSITAVFVQLAMGLAIGASIVVSQYFGAGKTDKIRSCASTSAIFSGVVGLISTIIMWIWAEPILLMTNTPPEIVGMGVDYLRFYFLGSVPIFVYNALSSVYNALGNSKTPLKFLIISSVTNVVLDLVFIVNFQWGVAGAAAATALSQVLAMILALIDVPKLLSGFERTEKAVAFDGRLLLTMLRFALPSALQQSIISVGSVVVQATINSFGSAVIAGSAAAAKVINLASAIPINYANAYASYVGQNVGARKLERIRPGLFSSIFCCGGISLVITVIFEIYAEPIIRMFVSETDADMMQVVTVGAEYVRVVGAFLVLFSVMMLTKATFKGAGDMFWFIFVTLLSFVVRLILTVGLAGTFGVDIIWWAFAIGWIFSLAFSVGRYVQGGWKKKEVG
ncbi:MAG: MATE family efflux transporter [Lachnospiraceae bacterium]|nr:MATE family efflux transporter [Lachnospiraceae bacterium]